jgi:hypothetical protein
MSVARTRNTAAKHETEDIAEIILAINSRTPAGMKISAAFKDRFNLEINAARMRKGSSRGTHYDFEVEVDGVWKKVEHKGGQAYRLPNPDDAPWKAGVQFHNGGCEKYSLARKYAHVWYDTHLRSGSLTEEFGINAAVPEFPEWFEKDCRVQSDPKSLFGSELKRKVRQARGPKASLLEKRASVLDALIITEEDKATLAAEVLPIANHALEQKDYWLSIHGSLAGEFHAVWYPSFMIEAIREVNVTKGLDLNIGFVCEDGFTFGGIMRWGKGAGFSCLRLDLK